MAQTTTPSEATRSRRTLYIAFDLSRSKWQLALSDGIAKPRDVVVDRTCVSQAKAQFIKEVAAAKVRFGLPDDAPVSAVFEAGRDGFWISRWLDTAGVTCTVIDPASITVDRKAKQRKTDQIDARKLLSLLVDHASGRAPLHPVQVPSADDEDARTLQRLLDKLLAAKERLTNRILAVLFGQGIDRKYDIWLKDDIATLVTGDERHLGPIVQRELLILCKQVEMLQQDIDDLEQERAKALAAPVTETQKVARNLEALSAIGPIGAWTLAHELFGWRNFANGKHLASYLGLTPTPWASGDMSRDQGISKAGPSRIRALMIQLAWSWLRYQPESPISLWFGERWAKGGKRSRRQGIVAVARKLCVLLWRYATQGVVPDGVMLKAEDRLTQPKVRRITPKRRVAVHEGMTPPLAA